MLLVIPISFGANNDTAVLDASLNTTSVSEDVYFDNNASHDHGEGTLDDPYKELRDGRILDNSVIHLKNGEYEYSVSDSHTNIAFVGEDASKTIINGHGGILLINGRLSLSNITICNLNIFNQGNIYASNTYFANSSGINIGSNGDSFGGAIYCVDGSNNAYLTNCTFINNYATFGGAIYLNGGILEINDCNFINNTALNYGGAIACDVSNSINPRLTIKKSRFIQDASLQDAGGAIYMKSGNFKGEDLNVSSCSATFGGAFCLLKSYTDLSDVYAFNNSVKYDGGVIYQIYGNLTLINSQIVANHAKNGGGLYIDNSYYICIEDNSFINNSAERLAGAFYSLANDYSKINNTYVNNSAFEFDDLFTQGNLSLTFTSSNFTLYDNELSDFPIPSKYMSLITPAKNQLDGGNCWAFAILGAVESAILKASGDMVDLSEENMKNIASIYSHFGWEMDTNSGGYDDMGLGYLVSWLGPILESQDSYNPKTTLSPVLDSFIYIQNMEFLKKSSYYSLDHIKRAIMDYGALYSPIYIAAYYSPQVNAYVQCFRGSLPCNHAVLLVGWDDDFYIPGAPGKGAWIAKNSWGESWGNDGLFYVSYFDNSCPKLGDDKGAVAIILNTTIKYDKNYQYDVAKTDYFLNTTRSVWYKNIFTSSDNEYLAAVSTYFEKVTNWELSVNVNGILKATKSGISKPGYYTFDLDELIPIDKGDDFEVMFKITVDGDAGVPISESVSLNNDFYHENLSYISYDGKNWKDLFDLTWQYPDHIYDSQVACIKAFTVLNPINTTVDLSLNDEIVIAKVLNQWGYPVNSGNVTFKINDEIYTVKVVNGVASIAIDLKSANITAEFNAVGYNSSIKHVEMHYPLINTNITLNVTGQYNPINISAKILDEFKNPVKYGQVIFNIEGRQYSVDVVNGVAKLENIDVFPLKTNVTASYIDQFYYNSSETVQTIELLRIDTKIKLNITSTEANNPVKITAYVTDMDGNPVNKGNVLFVVSKNVYSVDVVNGVAQLNHTFAEVGSNQISAIYFDEYLYNSSSCNETLLVSKIKVNLTFILKIDENNAIIAVGIKDCIKEFQISVNLNKSDYSYGSAEGFAIAELKDLDCGEYEYLIGLNSSVYEADDLTGKFEITYQKTQIEQGNLDIFYNGGYSIILKDKSGNIIPDRDVYLTINGQTYKKRTNDLGIAVFDIHLPVGSYGAMAKFIGDDEYIKSSKYINFNVKSTIKFSSNTYAYNSKYTATLYDLNGNALVNNQVDVLFNNVNYKVNTDSKGQISLTVNSNPGYYSVKITNPATGEVESQNINVVKRITKNKDLTMYYGAGSIYKVRVCDDNGKFIKGLKVTFKINGKSYYAYTDKNGYASFKITQKIGKYTITASYKGFKVSNKITVKSTIITKNIKVKKGKIIKFTAKLVNKNGKILKNKKITFKFKGKTYKVKTDKKGKAVLKITKKYKKGKYTITSKYGKLSIKNKITIK